MQPEALVAEHLVQLDAGEVDGAGCKKIERRQSLGRGTGRHLSSFPRVDGTDAISNL